MLNQPRHVMRRMRPAMRDRRRAGRTTAHHLSTHPATRRVTPGLCKDEPRPLGGPFIDWGFHGKAL
jgi:hypothetical protein